MMMSDAVLEKLLELEAELEQQRIQAAYHDKTIKGIKHWLQVAADYQNDDPAKVAEAIQHALGRAAKYDKPPKFTRKRKERK